MTQKSLPPFPIHSLTSLNIVIHCKSHRAIKVMSLPSFLDQQHLFAFLMSVARFCAWLLLLALIFLPLERLSALHPQKFFRKALIQDLGYYSRRWLVGNLAEHSLPELWNLPEHIAFRERVQSFDFSPCSQCGSCEYSEKNEEDCSNNKFPTCGGCLWAQGLYNVPK